MHGHSIQCIKFYAIKDMRLPWRDRGALLTFMKKTGYDDNLYSSGREV